ncbi:MAG: biotin/lipoyl-containing protein [Desulfobulbus sp.]|jgi:biotin carboxyl carrier protein|nr:acetyl-CoA carboxylase biotin carboxyl carrier protein subunit [Desulfobulbaceae bacterium]
MGKVSRYKIQVDGITYRVSVEDESGEVSEVSREVSAQEVEEAQELQEAEASAPAASVSGRERIAVTSLLPGNVCDVLCKVGDEVKVGDTLLMLEAMKMQSPVYAPDDGVVDAVEIKTGDVVRSGQALVYLA